MIWVAIVRVPLILNARVHLDSDLAVDGLTLMEATRGHLRWHFPGTPHLGIGPVLVALPAALIFGATPWTLVLGGVLAYECVVLATFLLAWRLFGPRSAAWSLVPLAFASVGTIWLSGRLTGGHLLTVAWFAGTLSCLHAFLSRGGPARALHLGFWCGIGLYLDSMSLAFLPPLALVCIPAFLQPVPMGRRFLGLVAFLLGFTIGDLPREVGYRIDPYDSYKEQFNTVLLRKTSGPNEGEIDLDRTKQLATDHTRILALECLPRLIAGHRIVFPDLPWEPTPEKFGNRAWRRPTGPSAVTMITLATTGFLFAGAVLSLMIAGLTSRELASRWTSLALFLTVGLITVGFVINKNIFNSDNYRYLVFWLVAWAVGFGVLMESLWRKGSGGRTASAFLSLGLSVVMTADSIAWYQSLGWMEAWKPVQTAPNDPAYTWLASHPEFDAIFGDYWDVYRLQFLLGGRTRGLPYPVYPDRYDAARTFPARRPRLLVGRSGPMGQFYVDRSLAEGGRVLHRAEDLTVVDWPFSP